MQLAGEQILRDVAARAKAEETLVKTERAPNLFLAAVNVAGYAAFAASVANRFGTGSETLLGALAGAALSLAVYSYSNSVRVGRRLEAALYLARQSAA